MGATLDLYDIEKPAVSLRMTRGDAQALARGEVPEHIRATLVAADQRLHANLQLKAGALRREGEDLIKLAGRLRESR